jgi:hypothetical protein
MVKALMEKLKAAIHESSEICFKIYLEFTYLDKLLTIIGVCEDEDLKNDFYESVLNKVKATFTCENINELMVKFEWKIIKKQILSAFMSFDFDDKMIAIEV